MDLGVFFNNKAMGGVYTRYSSRYNVTETEATSKHWVGVAVFYRNSP